MARNAADLLGVNRKTAACFYHRLREIIAAQIEASSPVHGVTFQHVVYLAVAIDRSSGEARVCDNQANPRMTNDRRDDEPSHAGGEDP
ncbi:MAG: hypothetical protein INF14_03185 [Methylobacterium sp.]|nr:hypothetical protein [Methylobacterium sp.]MCA3701678.1 hypothetical protein [Methylobacterium sp.]